MGKIGYIHIGDLVCLNKKGERFIYGKTLCSPYYKPILQGNLGLVTNILGDKKDILRIVWFVRDGTKTTKRQTLVMSLNKRYLKKLNKR